MDMYCPQCAITLPLTAKRCTSCGNTATLAPGNVVSHGSENYTIVSVLGIGGMGIVYRATDSLSSDVVVKQVYADNPADLPDTQRRFKREAMIQAGINHPAFPQGFGYFTDQGFEFMAMEFVPGQDLEKTLAAKPGRVMAETEVLQLGVQICDGLDVLHNYTDPSGAPDPIIHRDIKPANIILRPSGQICILDLGIARALKQSAATQARATRAGTFEYCSPQQVSGTDMSIRDDLYSVAATLFHLRTGNSFTGDFSQRPGEIDQLPSSWRAAFRRAINNDTNLRQRSANDLKQDLIFLLPPALQPQSPLPSAAVPVPSSPGNSPVTIRWRVSASSMANVNEWHQPVGGQIVSGGQGLAGVNILSILTDVGSGLMALNARGTAVQSSQFGDFGLGLVDVTVPVTVDRREILIIVEDPNTGSELYREQIEINRPGIGQRARVRGAAGVGAAAAPFRAAGQGIAYPLRRIGQGGRRAMQAAGRGLRRVQPTANNIATAAFVLFLLMMVAGVALNNAWLWTIAPLGMILSARIRSLAKKNRFRWLPFPRLTFAWLGSWLVFLIAYFFGR